MLDGGRLTINLWFRVAQVLFDLLLHRVVVPDVRQVSSHRMRSNLHAKIGAVTEPGRGFSGSNLKLSCCCACVLI
jgi:hypothetical protein